MTAFLALSFALKKFQIPGRTQLLGTPAEENGGGKAQLIDAGAYKGVDVSLMAYVLNLPRSPVSSCLQTDAPPVVTHVRDTFSPM